MADKTYGLTNPQKLIWYTQEFYKGTSIENIVGTVIIPQMVDFSMLERAINIFVEKNDSFRLKFILENQQVKQYVDSYSVFPVETINVSSEEDLKNVEESIASSVFDVFSSYLFVFKLIKFPDGHGGFIICMHHLITDAWSAGLGASEIIRIYTRLLNNDSLDDIFYPSYVDYINSEAKYLSSEKYNKDKEFWNSMFNLIPEVATIPSLNTTCNNELLSIANRAQFTLSKDLIDKITVFCKNNGFSAFNFFMAIFSIYIGKCSKADEFVIGTPVLNRCNINEKHTSGMFVSTVPLKLELQNNIKFTELASSIGTRLFSIFKHQKYSYLSLLEDLRCKQSSLPNLYNILISYQNIRSTAQTSQTPYEINWIPSKYISDDMDIHIYDMNNTGNINIAYDYKVEKYSSEDIKNIHARALAIIDQVLLDNDISISNIEIVTSEEKQKILYDFNNTKMSYPKDKTITQLFEEQVKKTPDRVALVFGNKEMTYKELDEKSNSLANFLRSKGITRNNIIGIMVNRSLEMIVSILAVLKSGATYIPIDPEYPQDRIEYMLNNSNAKFLLTFNKLNDKVSFENKIFIELDSSDVYDYASTPLENINEPSDSSYIIYTSGSTGLPKGVVLTHRALSNLTNYCNHYVKYLKEDVYRSIVSVTTVSFDIFIFETLISLQHGLKLVIANEDEQNIPHLLNALLLKNNVSIIQTTPARMKIFVNNLENIPALKNLDFITLAGEQLPLSLVEKLKEISGATIYNGYGPSETTVFSTLTDVTNHNPITIGRPLDNTIIYILDSNLHLLPIGIPGEIYIAGDGLGKGYLNREDLTAKSFIPNPFVPNTLMYKTGDLAYFRNDGEIICLGRLDNQVKIRGLRIELEEIEHKILENKDISNCVVVKKVDDNSHEFLCAYYTAKNDIDLNSLRARLATSLPNYMVPQFFMKLKELPYTPNGKINRKLLPTPKIEKEKHEIIKPRNNIDASIIDLLKELTNVTDISIKDSFFELGGDSLTAINLCAKIYNSLSVQISVKDIFEHPILEDLSNIISSRVELHNITKIEKAPESNSYPLSSAQKRMYISSTMAGEDSILYNIPGGIILDKMPDIAKLESCLTKLINRHESLRTYFDVVNNDIVQKIEKSIDFKLDVATKEVAPDKLKQEFDNFVKPFNLSKAPLFRAKLIKLIDSRVVLFVDMHHIISDGTSLSIFINELCKLYNNQTLDELKLTYKDFAVWENSSMASGGFEASQEFWVNQFLDEVPVLNLPTNYPRPSVKTYTGAKVYSSIDSKKINEVAEILGITPYMLLLSVYYILLKKYTMQDDIIVGSPIVGRDNLDTYNIIGMFVNTLALRTSIDSKKSFKEFAEEIKALCLDSFSHQTYPFDELISKIDIPKDASRSPLFDTMFIYQNNNLGNIDFGGIKSEYYIPDAGISKFDLSLEITPDVDKFKMCFEYATDLFNHDFIQNMAEHYINILDNVLSDINVKISNIDMLSPQEKDTILNKFNNTNIDFRLNKTIAQTFEDVANGHADSIAVVFENQKLTYKELNEKANSLAHSLRKLGIDRNDIVGIICTRSLEMIIAVLAVLKAGGTYILIDNSLPSSRVKYMLSNSQAKLLVKDKDYGVDFDNQFDISNFDYSKNTANLKCCKELSDSFAVIYTSGSTGNPKGVLLKESGLLNLIHAFDKVMNIGSSTSHLGLAAVSFDMFAVELFTSVLLGRTLYLLNDEELKNPVLMSKKIIDNKVEFLITTPTKIELLMSNAETAKCLKVLKGIQLGGEVFTPSLFEKLSTLTNAQIHNGYGPTEITACCSNKLITSKDDINIGSPIPNDKIYILDNDQNICPIDVPGELCVSGTGVSLGYVNDKAKTSKVFIHVNFTDDTLYRTGDIAKYNENGELEYIGRNDFQVKLNGLRIELSEIEKKLLSIKEIENAVVLCDKSKTFLKAFYTATETLSIPAIRKRLFEILPTYMVPKYIFQVDAIPMTPNGKVDRKALDLLKTDVCEENIEYVAPETDTQKLFCKIWEDILETKVGIDNDLFELGADSLSAIKFKVEALNNNIDIPYADIFKYKTIRKLSESKVEENITTPIEDFNYDNINVLLKKNRKQLKYKVEKCKNNNVLLLGSNGFVGMHIIDSFIKNDKGIIYCVMRDKNGKGALNRFLDVLHFYFGDTLDKYIGNRIIVLKGDIIKENFGLSNRNYEMIINNTSTIINAAANVKHFGNFEKFKSINIDAIKQTIEFCKNYSKRLIHLSTLSISGNMFLDGTISRDTLKHNKKVYFAENNLFINQSLDNVYTRSKFEAEKIILDEIQNGLDAQILRLGNITSRASDGKFQINPDSNAFTNRLKSFVLLGVVPKSLLKQQIEFTAVDLCSDAIIKVLQNKSSYISVLHLYNRNHTTGEKLFKGFSKLGIHIKPLDDEAFANYINEHLSEKSIKGNITGIINDLSVNKKISYTSNTYIKSDFSVDFLLHCKFKWGKINKNYIEKYIKYLKSINFFENN